MSDWSENFDNHFDNQQDSLRVISLVLLDEPLS
jgi:hypothetical protein